MGKARRHEGTKARRRWGFTLTELMVAVAVLVVVILATGRIFGTVSKVSGLGNASTNVLQEAAAIERQLRDDIANLSHEGFLAIQSVAVTNDINVSFGGALLNPSLPFDATIRADQLVFFRTGVQSTQTYTIDSNTDRKGQSAISRVYYGHAFQLPLGRPFDNTGAHDPDMLVWPWHDSANPAHGLVDMARTNFSSGASSFARTDDGQIDGTQPEARRWLLARQPLILADDGGDQTVFLGNNMSAYTIWLNDPVLGGWPQVQNGRVDAAATQLNDIRRTITLDAAGGSLSWAAQRSRIAQAIYYPRAETFSPGPHRVDQALTNHVIASGCSSLIIEWTYADGTGFTINPADENNPFLGVGMDSADEQYWFGLADPDRNVFPFFDWSSPGATITPGNIEQAFPGAPIGSYSAIFGYNQNAPLNASGVPDPLQGYTPWPTAIRITMVLHDPETRLETGRQFQFVLALPQRPR